MKSFAFMRAEVSPDLFYLVWTEIEKLKWYFVRFAGPNSEEAMQKTLMHAVTHYNANNGKLSAYIKKLAREITKDNGRLVFVDFLEQTLSDDIYDGTESSPAGRDSNPGRVSDFSDDVIDNIMQEQETNADVIDLALIFMDKFILMCEALINMDTSTIYYPDVYKEECLKLLRKNENFNDICLNVYATYGDEFKSYLKADEGNVGVWREADYMLLDTHVSKRVTLYNSKTNRPVTDADTESFYVYGKLQGKQDEKRILKVRYIDLWDQLCDLVDSEESNVLKFIIDDEYIVRTLGGSQSVINPELYNIYDLIRAEILTNVLQDLRARILNIGSSHFYLLVSSEDATKLEDRVIKGIPIKLSVEDITDSVL